jgi:hypothetical protein
MHPNPLLDGTTLVWVTFDPQRTFSAGVRSLLVSLTAQRDWLLEIHEANSLASAAGLVEQHGASLLTVVTEAADFAGLCKTLRRVQSRRPSCVRLVYTPLHQAPDGYSADHCRLLEVGAQIVVDQIPWVQRLLPSILDRIAPRPGGCHPLTTGLVDTLPWPDVR